MAPHAASLAAGQFYDSLVRRPTAHRSGPQHEDAATRRLPNLAASGPIRTDIGLDDAGREVPKVNPLNDPGQPLEEPA